MKHLPALSLILMAGLMAFSSCSKEVPVSAKPMIAVSILPQKYFVERIAGEKVDTVILVGPGQSPHAYEPTPKQMGDLSKAKAWILSNSDFELGLRPKIQAQYPSLIVVDGTKGVRFRQMEAHAHEGEKKESDKAEQDANIDRHTWLGREPAKIMAGHIRDTMLKIDPSNGKLYDKNFLDLVSDIDREFDALIPQLAFLKGTTVFVFHPSFGYFLDEFGIEQEAVETGGKEPTAKALTALIAEARRDKVKVIFVQAQFPTTAAKTLGDALGAQVLPLDPLSPDWLENIRRIGLALKNAAR